MPADGLHDRDAGVEQLLAEVPHLTDAVRDVGVVDHLTDADCHGLHVAPREASVRSACPRRRTTSSRARCRIDSSRIARKPPMLTRLSFLRRHRDAVEAVHRQAQDVGHGQVGVARLALLDEVGVLRAPGRVAPQQDAVGAGTGRWTARRLARHTGWPAGHVHGDGDIDVRDLGRTDVVDEPRELARSTLPLKSPGGRGVVRLVDDHVDEGGAGELLVRPGRGEVHVARRVLAVLDEDLRDEVLGAAALVRRDDEREPVDVLDGVARARRTTATPAYASSPDHQRGPLPVAHRRGARVGEQVDVHVLAAQQEGVVSRRAAIAPCGARRVVIRIGSTALMRYGSAVRRGRGLTVMVGPRVLGSDRVRLGVTVAQIDH